MPRGPPWQSAQNAAAPRQQAAPAVAPAPRSAGPAPAAPSSGCAAPCACRPATQLRCVGRSAGAGMDYAQPSGSVGVQQQQCGSSKPVEPGGAIGPGTRPGHQAEAGARTMHVAALSGDAAGQPSLSMQPQKWRSSATIPAGRTSVESSASCISFSACACPAGMRANSTDDGQAKPADAPPRGPGLCAAIGPRLMQLAPTSCSVYNNRSIACCYAAQTAFCSLAAAVHCGPMLARPQPRTCR